jgi:hypothetical protein
MTDLAWATRWPPSTGRDGPGRKIGRLARMVAGFGADLGGGWRQPARNALLRLAPARLLMRAGTQVVNWTPP